ncbi:acetyl/propionyl/methylcrotonyl-CoA carboxylase subunit alpha [Aeromicrobium duanguangcaii]|uniref:ATP-grasp domain-containing protein n=1 Tax=Aeromicrobium duanguangcaii TaxID=2968086 RepID=A0ABY5KGN0_9ACTN|nr:biotin carboxylase N-terminal domain-containing protein [Aeromicrobium duanguangcaii]MCD9154327.1 ATP-grasp domain-containing protein [Aeromicrobium duanguangcaii]UUI68606.1 ATP-grasp domain-containing protein [Aeromicrobium duanguangcaii]
MALHSVLVANRGEIAARVLRACRELGIRSVAVHVPGDVAHVALADTVVEVPSYLDGAAIIEAARSAGAEAIHPGYGFLSENAGFARAVTDAGLVFVGPSADVIELMGRKDRAREVAERAGVPVMSRYEPEAVPADAYPVLVKAAAGGGGKGMHVVRRPDELAEALAMAAREARAAFGDDTLLIERYVEGGRHVEVQVFGDDQGNVVHLLDRDCSVQRRHQKVVEEAPAPDLDPRVRDRIRSAAVALCREVGYVNAGTVEYLVMGQEAFFLEMNTRLQVEHPVTEEVTATDLVHWQLAVAAGEPLPLTQDEIVEVGHAIEVRVYAEDPAAGFLPQAGRIREVWWPGARVESVIDDVDGADVTASFDPMIAKIITTGDDRAEAVDAMVEALDMTAVFGIRSNVGFLRRVVDSATFRDAAMDTGWLDTAPEELLSTPEVPAQAAAVAARLLWPEPDDGWRSAGPAAALRLPVVDEEGTRHDVTAWSDHVLPSTTDGARAWVAAEGETYVFERPDGTRRPRVLHAGDAEVTAPMPGTVIAVDVEKGDRVEAGQRLGAVEAMKMELALTAAHAGTVTEVATVGRQVKMGELLFHVEPLEES